MKRVLVLSAVIALSSFVTKDAGRVKNTSFGQGEVLEYRLHFAGVLTAGEARMEVNPTLYQVDGKACYKITATGKTTGAVSKMYKVKDLWRSYVDTESLVPTRFQRDLTEGKYTLKESTYFDHSGQKVKVKYRKKNKALKEKNYSIKSNTHDMISAFYYFRNLDMSKFEKGDIVPVNAFLEDEFYSVNVKFMGKQIIKIKNKKYEAYKIVPVVPDNQTLFDGKDAVRAWLSADENKIPLRIEADMFVGKVQLDLKGYSGLKHELSSAM